MVERDTLPDRHVSDPPGGPPARFHVPQGIGGFLPAREAQERHGTAVVGIRNQARARVRIHEGVVSLYRGLVGATEVSAFGLREQVRFGPFGMGGQRHRQQGTDEDEDHMEKKVSLRAVFINREPAMIRIILI